MRLVSLALGQFAGERLRVELRPGSVTLSRSAALPRVRVAFARSLEVTAANDGGEHPPESWRASVDTLASALREQREAVGRVAVVLSDHFVRYTLIPWSENLVADSERLGFARLGFRNVYGPLADGWEVCVDQQPAGQASFAAAIDRPLIVALRDVVSLAGGRLDAVEPALADCLNRHSRVLKEREFCLAMSEPGRISLAFRSRAGWQAVRSRRIDGPVEDVLPTLLKQESAAGTAPESGVLYLCAADIVDLPHFVVQGWKVVRLAQPGGSPSTRASAGMQASARSSLASGG
jgi:hypothetical protein